MAKPLFVVTALLLLLLIPCCVSDQAHRYYADRRYPPREPDEVEVLFKTPEQEHEVIADFQARGASARYMQKKAAKIGADAVIIGTYGGWRAVNEEWASRDQYSGSYTRISGTAIRYTGR